MPNSLIAHPDFGLSSLLMIIINSGIDNIVPYFNSISLSSQSPTLSPNTLSINPFTSYGSIPITLSDICYQTNDKAYFITEKNTLQIFPEVPCSTSGSTIISYSINYFSGLAMPPSWISIDPTTGVLNISTPAVSTLTQYYFYINSNVALATSTVTIPKLIGLTVIKCNVQNCQRCSSSSGSVCEACNSYYEVSSGVCVPSPTIMASSLKTTTQCLFAAITGTIILLSMLNASSLSSIWSIMNQIQILFLLFLTGAFIPTDVQTVITGIKIAINLPNYFEFDRIEAYRTVFDSFNFNLKKSEYDLLDLQSESTVYNICPTLLLGAFILILHLLVAVLNKYSSKLNTEGKCRCPKFTIKLLLNKVFIMLTFGYYIRYALEMNQFILVSCMNEISNFDTSKTLKIISLIFAIFVLMACFILIGFVSYLSLSSYEAVEDQHNKIGEFFSGVKMNKKSKFYAIALLVRRTLFVILLISLSSLPSRALIAIVSVFQILYTGLIIYLRPFREVKCNIIEIMNEIYFFILLCSLSYLNTESDWNDAAISLYIWFLSSNTILAFIVIFADTLKTVILKIKHSCSNSDERDPKVSPCANNQISSMVEIRDTSVKLHSEIQSRSVSDNFMSRNENYILEENKINLENDTLTQQAIAKKKDWS